jgi:23S rRNA (uracil1939-C5)-methyltransferase
VVINTKNSAAVCLPENIQLQSVIIEDAPNVKLAIESSHFLQVNKAVNKAMIKQAIAWLDPNTEHTLYDFFCGSGNFALSFANKVKSVKGYEGHSTMVNVAKTNAEKMAVNNCEFISADLSSTDDLKKIEFEPNAIVILDPSREGAYELCQYLTKVGVFKILYVSCNANSFVRDASYLLQNVSLGTPSKGTKPYELTKVCALDMFPFTKHLELMALFTLAK